MKKTKVENVSKIKLDFFVKQNKEDVRIVLKPGESSWCDHGSITKSMILYERKNLIKSSENIVSPLPEESKEIEIKPIADFEAVQNVIIKYLSTPEEESALDKAQKETEEYKQESEKKYKGKKRGRKKKRGPKPGSKRNKGQSPETPSV